MTAPLAPRVEVKYCLPEHEAAWALRLASTFLEPDAEGGLAEQRISSLYLESPALTFLQWHVQRRTRRFKLRIREYGRGDAHTVYAEVKHKVQGVTHKDRCAVLREAVPSLLFAPAAANTGTPADPFVALARGFGALPVVMIRCDRTALRGGTAGGLRVTVDRRLEAQPWPHGRLATPGDRGWSPLALPDSAHDAVLEIKHDGRPPRWMALLMDGLAPWRRSMSKYVTAMSQSHLDQGVVS